MSNARCVYTCSSSSDSPGGGGGLPIKPHTGRSSRNSSNQKWFLTALDRLSAASASSTCEQTRCLSLETGSRNRSSSCESTRRSPWSTSPSPPHFRAGFLPLPLLPPVPEELFPSGRQRGKES